MKHAVKHANRSSIPKMGIKTETSVEKPFNATSEVFAATAKPSRWTRVKAFTVKTATVIAKPFKAAAVAVKNATVKTAKFIAKPFKALATKMKPATQKTVAYTKYLAYRATYATKSTKPFFVRLWRRSLRPMLRYVMYVVAIAGTAIGLTVAPVYTVLAIIAMALLFFAMAKGVEKLERAEGHSKAARYALFTIEALAYIVRAAFYTTAALLLLAACSQSLSLSIAVGVFTFLSYRQIEFASTYAFYAWCIASGNWTLLVTFVLLDVTVYVISGSRAAPTRIVSGVDAIIDNVPVRAPVDVVDAVDAEIVSPAPGNETTFDPHVKYAQTHMSAKLAAAANEDITPAMAPDAPETWTRGNFLVAKGTEELWGTEHDAAPKFVIHDDADEGRSIPVVMPDVLMAEAEQEADAIRLFGVSSKARSCEVKLTPEGIAATEQFIASKQDLTMLFWLETSWWRDRQGHEHAREWSLLHDGHVVAFVAHDFKRKSYRVSAQGKYRGTKSSKQHAMSLATDTLNDEANAVTRLVESLSELAGTTEPAVQLHGQIYTINPDAKKA